MHFYSIHVTAEYNLSGSEIICRQRNVVGDGVGADNQQDNWSQNRNQIC